MAGKRMRPVRFRNWEDTSPLRGTVYLIHLDRPFHHAQHYIGFAHWFVRRIGHHRNGTGSRLLAAVNGAGIGWEVVRIWRRRSREFERKLKNKKNARGFCPACQQQEGGRTWRR